MAPGSPEPVFDRVFQDVPADVDLDAIRADWRALRPPYQVADRHLPLPVWARRPFTESGRQAWRTLRSDVPAIDRDRAFCIYLHIPFCGERCPFCDCYAFRLRSHRDENVERYLGHLSHEIDLWSVLGTLSRRPVSTVHLGGGTPTFLGASSLARLVNHVRAGFSATPRTEWALESTVYDLSPEMLAHLDDLGFTRLHIGVQTLQDEVRARLGRRTTVAQAISTIAATVAMGWIVSVDLILGLPGQDLGGLLADIRTLAGIGINGFSLYELQFSSRNRPFVRQHLLDRQDRRVRYFLAQSASGLLLELGYRKTLFNHFADDRDTNLYFTFPERGEDCLALGAIADGSFGDFHYRHPEYAPYGRAVDTEFPGLQGGLRRNALENRLQPLTVGLLAGRVPGELLAEPFGRGLLDRWLESRLLEVDPQTGGFLLTGNGSWFVGNMITEVHGCCEQEAEDPPAGVSRQA